MMRTSLRRLGIVLLLGPGLALAANIPSTIRDDAKQLRQRALTESNAYAIVESLVLEAGPRLAGSKGDEAAVAWALLKLEELGFENVRAEDVEVPHWERGETRVEITTPFPHRLVATALGGSFGTDEDGIEAPVLMVTNIAELEELPRSRVEGTIVFFNDRMEPTRDASSYSRVVRNRAYGPSAAARLGAVAAITRSAGTSSDRIAHTGSLRYADDAPRIPAAAISNPDANLLERQMQLEDVVTLSLSMTSRHLEPRRSANVIGELRGTDAADEIVLIGAHLDSWDLGQGAVDDGSGVAIAIEAVRQIREAGLRPRRTIRVVLYANEEFGVSGGKAYAEKYSDQVAQHIIGLEADLGPGKVWRFDVRVAAKTLPLVEEMHKLIEPLGIARGNNEAYGGADLVAMRDLGMPVLGPRQDASLYFEVHHTVNDTLDKISREGLDQNVATYAVLTYIAAAIEQDFGRLPPPDSE
jgi:carboxypeptidase Q